MAETWQRAYRKELAQRAFNNDERLRFFKRWIDHLDGCEIGTLFFPADEDEIDHASFIHFVLCLSDDQLDDLCWRMIIPTQPGREHILTLDLSFPLETAHEIEGQAVVVVNSSRTEVLYDLRVDDVLLRLRPGELELLVAAGLPGTIDEVLAILWRRIAPAAPAEQDDLASDASPR